MTLAAPWNLLWLVPALGAIVALYLLRRPRRNVVVPSTLFWRGLPSDDAARATRLQPLPPQLLLFLQLLAAFFAVFSSAHPEVRAQQSTGRIWALVLDNGVGMNATDIFGGRLSAAKALATKFIQDHAQGGSRFCIVQATPPRVLFAGLGSAVAAERVIDTVRATDAAADIPAAVSLAASVLHPTDALRVPESITLISDDAWPAGEDAAVSKSAGLYPFSVLQVGSSSAANVGITHFAVSRDPAQPDRALQVLVRVEAVGGANAACGIALSVGGKQVRTDYVNVSPGTSASLTIPLAAPARTELLTARLTTRSRNDLSTDDTATAVLPAAGKVRVLLISDGDPPLERAIGLLPGIEADEVHAAAYRRYGSPDGYALYIFDGVTPQPNAALSGSVLQWGVVSPESGPSANDSQAPAPVTDWNRSAPAMRFIDLSGASIAAPAWRSVGDWEPLIETNDGIIAAQRDDGTRRELSLSFLPGQSGFASQPMFPIFISNVVAWLTQTSAAASPTGTPIMLAPVTGGWTVTGPDGVSAGLCDGSGSACSETDTYSAGVYEARAARQSPLLFARDVAPGTFDIIPKRHQIRSAAMRGESPAVHSGWSDATLWGAMLCLGLIGWEWAVYHRRASRSGLRQAGPVRRRAA